MILILLSISSLHATDPVTLLQGQLPSLQVIQNSGEPGNEGTQLRIRGTGTFSGAENDPLVIVDGLPGNLNIINPNNIESVTVLKDAASAAIYGARGANGVNLVKLKKEMAVDLGSVITLTWVFESNFSSQNRYEFRRIYGAFQRSKNQFELGSIIYSSPN